MSKQTLYILISASIGVVIACGVYAFLFITIKSEVTEVSRSTNELDLAVKKDQRLHSIKALTADLAPLFATVDTYLIPDNGVVSFLERLEEIGRSTGAPLTVNAVNIDGSLPEISSYERLRIEFIAKGDWDEVSNLLGLFETLPYGIVIEGMQLERIEESSSKEWELRTTFTIPKLK